MGDEPIDSSTERQEILKELDELIRQHENVLRDAAVFGWGEHGIEEDERRMECIATLRRKLSQLDAP